MTVRSYAGAAKRTTLSAGISNSALSFTVTAGGGSGYPTGADGPFVVLIDHDTAGEEKALCSGRTGDTFTVQAGGRGYDDTIASAHGLNAPVDHVGAAVDFREANAHVNDVTGDPHPQYLTPAEASAAYLTPAVANAAYLTPAVANAAYRALAAIAVRAYVGTAQTIPSTTPTALLLGSESHKQGITHDNVTNSSRLTIVTAGRYRVTAQVEYPPATGQIQVRIHKNGTLQSVTARENNAGSNTSLMTNDIIVCAATDYLEVFAYQASGGNLTVPSGATSCFLAADFIGT